MKCAHCSRPSIQPELIKRLTKREQEVLLLTANGYKGQEVAEALGVKLNTARSMLNIVRYKLHVETTAEAVVIAVRAGLVQ